MLFRKVRKDGCNGLRLATWNLRLGRAAPGPKLSACAPRRHSIVVKRFLGYHGLLTRGKAATQLVGQDS
jgi:hypothetical protein